ncbi:MAG: hypothetical protein MUC89_21300 [Acetobacteraceae bacterium]|jgi:hypothetical protein|nr:hypothetical protein [Acetobacteraceae bacterium]
MVLCAAPAQAAFVMTMQQVGNDVVASGSGSISDNSFGLSLSVLPTVRSAVGWLVTGDRSGGTTIRGGVSGPASFGTGNVRVAPSSTTGVALGIFGNNGDFLLADSYVMGTPMTSGATWANATFASLGLTPGTYVWTWNTNSYTLNIIEPTPPTAVPAPPALALFGLGLAGLLAARRRG